MKYLKILSIISLGVLIAISARASIDSGLGNSSPFNQYTTSPVSGNTLNAGTSGPADPFGVIDTSTAQIPVDGGLSLLLLAGAGLGVKRMKRRLRKS